MTRAEEAIAQDDAANAIADRFTRWARWVLAFVALGVLIGTPAVWTVANVLVHQSSTLDHQATALANDRKASKQRDTVVDQQRELLDRQGRFESLLADLLAAKTAAQANAIRAQIGEQFGTAAPPPPSSSSSAPASSTTTTTRPARATTTTAPPRPTPSTTTTTTTAPPPSGPPPGPIPRPVCAVLPVCPSASGVRPFITFGL